MGTTSNFGGIWPHVHIKEVISGINWRKDIFEEILIVIIFKH